MGCCGKRSYNTTILQGTKTIDIAAEGVTQLEYIGNRTPGESFTTYGFFTGTQYRVTPGTYFMADNRDLVDSTSKKAGLLQQLEGNTLRFAIVEQTPIVEQTTTIVDDSPVIEPQTVTVVQEFAEPEATKEDLVDFSTIDTTAQVAAKRIKDGEFTDTELDQLYTAESFGTKDGVGGKNRKTVLKAIEDAKSN